MKTLKNYKMLNLPALNEKQLKEIDALKIMDDNSVDLSAIPELTDDELKTGHFVYINNKWIFSDI